MMAGILDRLKKLLSAAGRLLDRHRIVLGLLLSAAMAGLLAVHQVSSGPLSNLNDIGGWTNRAIFIVMSAVVHLSMLVLCVLLGRAGFLRTALRQLLVTAGLYIMLLAINQKAYAYVGVMQPVIRAMDAGGLAAGLTAQGVSAPMLLLTYLITRGPVYDMYLLKLFAIGCYLLLALFAMRAADRTQTGMRAEALLALCMILPQAFMNAACSALPEIAAVTLLAVSLTLAFGCDRPKMIAAFAVYGAACALSGAALYALPVYGYCVRRGRAPKKALAVWAGAALALCVPAVAAGMPVLTAVCSLAGAQFGLPAYASGAPGVVNLIPRAAVEEIPQYAAALVRLPALDLQTYAQEFYTQAHFESVMHGFAWAGLAMYLGAVWLALRAKDKSLLQRALIAVLGALMACPNVTTGMWLAADVLCLYAIVTEQKLRLPACLVLFATMTSSSYPMTQEVMLPMILAFALCLAALCMLLDVIVVNEKREEIHE